ncbi:Ger(x)C family spore germination protein [Paenibacillus solisilvae]|uniref:Ger(X)C family spore germination protein n=1 Tax=Paenibacillus solisilvae TaxID=2486751 RepID=A0ABW0WA94_9BACL
MRKHWKIAKLFVALISTLCLCGCWDRQDINDKSFVIGVGIDGHKENIELTVELISPVKPAESLGSAGGGKSKSIVYSSVGTDLSDCMSKLQGKISRKLFWQHNGVILIGKNFAETDIKASVDYFARNTESRLRPMVVLAQGKAGDFFTSPTELENTSSEKIRELLTIQGYRKYILSYLLQRIKGDSDSFVLPMIKQTKQITKPKNSIQLNGLGIIQNNRLIGRLNLADSSNLLHLFNQTHFNNPLITHLEKEGSITIQVMHLNTKIQPRIKKNRWQATVEIAYQCDIKENTTRESYDEPATVLILEEEMKLEMKQRFERLINSWKKRGVDIFGFAETFHRGYPKEWNRIKQDWKDIFPTVVVDVQIKFDINRPGNIY